MVWEVSLENVALAIERWKKLSEKYKEAPKKYPKTLFAPISIGGDFKGFTIVEADNEE